MTKFFSKLRTFYAFLFLVNGEWFEVIIDTLIPCQRDNYNGELKPVYGHSIHRNEMWISLVEKAFAKALGSYEAIHTIKALLHLTGGSVQQYNLHDEVAHSDCIKDHHPWLEFKNRVARDGILLLLPDDKRQDLSYDTSDQQLIEASAGADGTKTAILKENYFVPNHLDSVVMVRDIGGYELILMHNPWNHEDYSRLGEWSDASNDWDLYPKLQVELENDPSVPWRRRNPKDTFGSRSDHLSSTSTVCITA